MGGDYRDFGQIQHMIEVSGFGARHEARETRRSRKASTPPPSDSSSRYLSPQRRNVRLQTPSISAACACVRQRSDHIV